MVKDWLNKLKDLFSEEEDQGLNETNRLKELRENIVQQENKFSVNIKNPFQYEDMVAINIQRTADQDVVNPNGTAMDSWGGCYPNVAGPQAIVPNSLIYWYGTQNFIGYQMAAIMAQHWLIDKCCSMPARDAIRNGYDITINDGTEVKEEVIDAIKQADITYRINQNLEEFITKGRTFGIRIAMFLVDSSDIKYYEKPFNIDGVTPGSYRGIVQVDPYWITPELDLEAGGNPASMFFYEPTWWRVNAKRIHRTHLIIFRNGDVPDLLKPTYMYGGIPVPQQIYEKVYNAERSANEVPQLILTKRSIVMKTDIAMFNANQALGEQKLQIQAQLMNNYGTKVVDLEDEILHLDTSLADLDQVITGQYQLVAAAAKIPVTKLLGTQPKGFNATGEFDEASYHEELESIQANDLTPLLERHHLLLIRSIICPKFNITPFVTTVTWKPTDSPTALELATLNKLKADTDSVVSTLGAIDGYDVRKRLINDPDSGYNGLEMQESLELPGGDPYSDPAANNLSAPNLEKFTQYDPEDLTDNGTY